MHVCLIGDSHGNVRFLRSTLRRIAAHRDANQVDVLAISLGDFGFWPGQDGWEFVQAVQSIAETTGVPLWVLDGNHDYPGHRGAPESYRHWSNHEPDPVATKFCHLPRGTRFGIGATVFGVCGGAVSIDRRSRKPGRSWWHEESITDEDVESIESTDPVDVLLAHDAPWPPAGTAPYHDPHDPDLRQDLDANHRRLQQVVAHWFPELVIHGHWHMPCAAEFELGGKTIKVVGLGYEDLDTATLVLDAGDRSLHVLGGGAAGPPSLLP